MTFNLSRRVAALERTAATDAPAVLIVPADARTANIGGERFERADDESADAFEARLRKRGGPPFVLVAGSTESRL